LRRAVWAGIHAQAGNGYNPVSMHEPPQPVADPPRAQSCRHEHTQ